MRRTLAPLGLVLGVLALGASPAGAITGNFQRDFTHTYVGLIAFYDDADHFTHRCTGSLISPQVFLTAGHCTDATTGATNARIWFQQDAGVGFNPATGDPAPSGYPKTSDVTSHHLYNYGFANFAGFPDTHDVGVVVLDKPISETDQASLVTSFGSLAAPQSLDRFSKRKGQQEIMFTVSGYGLSLLNPVKFVSFRERLMATEKLINLTNSLTDGFNVQTSASPGNGRGGTCSGDSGAPLLYDATNIITAVNTFGLNENCRGVDFMYRVDRAAVQTFIHDSIVNALGSTAGEAEWSTINIVSLPS